MEDVSNVVSFVRLWCLFCCFVSIRKK